MIRKKPPSSKQPPGPGPTDPAREDLGLSGVRSVEDSEGLSLDQLSGALADMLSKGHDPYSELPAASPLPAGSPGEPVPSDPYVERAEAATDPGDELVDTSPLTILEAMLFVGTPDNAPLSARQVAGLMRGVRVTEIEQYVQELNTRYRANNCPYEIVSEASGYRLALREPFHRVREKVLGRSRQVTLSPAAIEVLAIVAYQQPVTADQVTRRRGTPSGAVLSQLVRRELLRVERGGESGRAQRYVTTDRFLQLFQLRSLEELPRSQDLERQ